jgi:hypothetical protein
MMNLVFHKDKKYPNKLSNCRHCEVIMELFIRPWKTTISLGVRANRKNHASGEIMHAGGYSLKNYRSLYL